jgi:hypothetical protein
MCAHTTNTTAGIGVCKNGLTKARLGGMCPFLAEAK